jgi:hypothetical protein
VSSALSDLSRRDLIITGADEWLLKGAPPGELLDIDAGSVS